MVGPYGPRAVCEPWAPIRFRRMSSGIRRRAHRPLCYGSRAVCETWGPIRFERMSSSVQCWRVNLCATAPVTFDAWGTTRIELVSSRIATGRDDRCATSPLIELFKSRAARSERVHCGRGTRRADRCATTLISGPFEAWGSARFELASFGSGIRRDNHCATSPEIGQRAAREWLRIVRLEQREDLARACAEHRDQTRERRLDRRATSVSVRPRLLENLGGATTEDRGELVKWCVPHPPV